MGINQTSQPVTPPTTSPPAKTPQPRGIPYAPPVASVILADVGSNFLTRCLNIYGKRLQKRNNNPQETPKGKPGLIAC
jgi:hypothetical protein